MHKIVLDTETLSQISLKKLKKMTNLGLVEPK